MPHGLCFVPHRDVWIFEFFDQLLPETVTLWIEVRDIILKASKWTHPVWMTI